MKPLDNTEFDPDNDPRDADRWGGSGRTRRERENEERSRLPLVWFKDIQPSLDVTDFVQGVLVEGSSAVIYGESNAGKTFWKLDLALHVAAGRDWNGLRVEQGGVIYCVLEGSLKFRNRVAAWRSKHELDGRDIPFAAVEAAIDLLKPDADTDRLIELIQCAARDIDVPVKLVVIDTLSRALAGGNENAPDDMGRLVGNIDRIRAATGACVAFIHHSGKDTARGARGHSLLRAAIDTEIEVVDNAGQKTATVEKQRDMDKGAVFAFTLDVVRLGVNRHGEPVTTCIVVPSNEQARPPHGKSKGLTQTAKVSADLLRRAMDKHAKPLPSGLDYPPDTYAVTVEQWRQAYNQGVAEDNAATRRQNFRRAKTELLAKPVIASLNNWVWFCRPADE